MRTGAVIVAGAMIGQAVARRVARHENGSGERSRWLTVTVNAPPEKVGQPLADAVAERAELPTLTAVVLSHPHGDHFDRDLPLELGRDLPIALDEAEPGLVDLPSKVREVLVD